MRRMPRTRRRRWQAASWMSRPRAAEKNGAASFQKPPAKVQKRVDLGLGIVDMGGEPDRPLAEGRGESLGLERPVEGKCPIPRMERDDAAAPQRRGRGDQGESPHLAKAVGRPSRERQDLLLDTLAPHLGE